MTSQRKDKVSKNMQAEWFHLAFSIHNNHHDKNVLTK